MVPAVVTQERSAHLDVGGNRLRRGSFRRRDFDRRRCAVGLGRRGQMLVLSSWRDLPQPAETGRFGSLNKPEITPLSIPTKAGTGPRTAVPLKVATLADERRDFMAALLGAISLH